MYILGIKSAGHESAACLLKDGEIITAAEEERFNRIKHSGGFPKLAAEYCLKQAGISICDIDYVTSPINPWYGLPHILWHFIKYFPKSVTLAKDRSASGYKEYFHEKKIVYENLSADRKKCKFKFVPVEHHLSHAASAFFCSPFEEAAILSLDAVGEWTTTLLAYGKGSKIEKIKEIGFPHSIGFLYQAFTEYLGFKIGDGEGKVMGLAPYGNPDTYYDIFKDMVIFKNDGTFRLNMRYFDFHIHGHKKMLSDRAMKIFSSPRKDWNEKLTRHHEDVAAALQKITEETGIFLANYLYEKKGPKNICLAGGVALNSVMNMKILEQTQFEKIFIQPAANDAGAVLGSSVYLSNAVLGNKRRELKNAYLGPGYSEYDYLSALGKHNLQCKKESDIEKIAAKLIADENIIGWFQGRMEIGPRALGNRSILCDPRKAEMKDILNEKVKHREGFRPFAPTILLEHAGEYFENLKGNESPFMLLVPKAKEDRRKLIPAVIHVDGTGRVQTVSSEQNPSYYKLIEEFYKITNVPVVLNTSFNIMGQPIVNTPEQAIEMFLKERLDALVLGNYITIK